jgi:hypothetical protein
MNSTPLLIAYYNNIPLNSNNYFTISNGNLIISTNDMMNTQCSLFMANADNNLVYIFNGANMGSFIIDSLVSSDQYSTTYSINLNSIPLNLTDNVLCVLSINVPIYNTTRTFMTTMTSNIGNFNTPDNNTFIINTKSIGDSTNSKTSSSYNNTLDTKTRVEIDDTLFLYIIATNKSFNIIFSATTIHTIKDVILVKYIPGSFVFSGTFPPVKFTDNTKYTIYISTENSSTVSNVVLNNTLILPLNYSGIDLTVLNSPSNSLSGTFVDMSNTPSDTIEITPVLLNQTLVVNENNLNKIVNTQNIINQCVILNIQNPLFHNLSGYFSFDLLKIPDSKLIKGLNKDIIENFVSPSPSSTKIPEILKKAPANSSIFSSISSIGSVIQQNTAALSQNTYNTVIKSTGIPHESVMAVTTGIKDVTTTSYDSLSYAYKVAKVNALPTLRPDVINNVPLLVGLPSILNISYYDINNNQINFIAPNTIIYLSSGLNTIIYSILNAKNTINNPDDTSILSFDGEVNLSTLPDYSKNNPYVLSTGPITPFTTYSYINTVQYNTPVKNGSFTLTSTSNKLILSNIDATSMNVIPFISLLYTIINTSITLNILNLDYSIACSLIITGVALSQTQSTISYSIQSGTIPTSTTTNYIFTLLQTSDIINSVNNSKIYTEILTKNNNLILGIKNTINDLNLDNSNDINIQNAQIIIANAANQSTILLTTPFINNNSTTLQIANATVTMAFNAINYALLTNPTSKDLQYFYDVLTKLTNPIIVTTILNNTLNYITSLINSDPKSANIQLYTDAQNSINAAISQITVPSALDSPSLNTPSSVYIPLITNALNSVNIALVADPDNTFLLKAQSNLLSIEPITSGTYKIEKMSDSANSESSSMPSSGSIMCGLCLCLVIVGCAAYFINNLLSAGDEKLFSSESPSLLGTGE